ncbi:MAG: LLM class flavin-dependent oxidoreductase [Chloroflexi bacterium]|nr:LLM class flavin-dependent oxidoreductase [Chloroflexota bacterium]
MKYGFTLPGRGQLATPERLGIIARKGEELGFDALLTGDHILVPKNIKSVYPYTEGGEFPGSPSGESMEQITLLSYIAGQTRSVW